jgi:hypothetical protein
MCSNISLFRLLFLSELSDLVVGLLRCKECPKIEQNRAEALKINKRSSGPAACWSKRQALTITGGLSSHEGYENRSAIVARPQVC